jgi:hypothetical protein
MFPARRERAGNFGYRFLGGNAMHARLRCDLDARAQRAAEPDCILRAYRRLPGRSSSGWNLREGETIKKSSMSRMDQWNQAKIRKTLEDPRGGLHVNAICDIFDTWNEANLFALHTMLGPSTAAVFTSAEPRYNGAMMLSCDSRPLAAAKPAAERE